MRNFILVISGFPDMLKVILFTIATLSNTLFVCSPRGVFYVIAVFILLHLSRPGCRERGCIKDSLLHVFCVWCNRTVCFWRPCSVLTKLGHEKLKVQRKNVAGHRTEQKKSLHVPGFRCSCELAEKTKMKKFFLCQSLCNFRYCYSVLSSSSNTHITKRNSSFCCRVFVVTAVAATAVVVIAWCHKDQYQILQRI